MGQRLVLTAAHRMMEAEYGFGESDSWELTFHLKSSKPRWFPAERMPLSLRRSIAALIDLVVHEREVPDPPTFILTGIDFDLHTDGFTAAPQLDLTFHRAEGALLPWTSSTPVAAIARYGLLQQIEPWLTGQTEAPDAAHR